MENLIPLKEEHQYLESIIERGRQTFIEVGTALMTIREKRTYRTDGWDTFEEYCQERWGWTARRSNQLIEAASVVGDLGRRLPIPPPTNAGQASEMARVSDPKTRADLWSTIVSEHGADAPVRAVREAVRLHSSFIPPTERMTVADLGADIPPPPYIPPAERLMDQMTTVMIRALSTPIADAVEGVGDGQLSDTDLIARFIDWLGALREGLRADDSKIRRIK